ncbi:MAG: glycosyltransferase [Planctomycetota bacterium]
MRLFRYGLLAKRLVARGHRVTQWAGTLNHFVKKQRTTADATIPFAPGYDLRLMHGPAFSRNVGFARLRYQRAVSQSFRRQAEAAPRPDLIVASLPTLGLADEATRYGARWNTPVVVDVRDLWPDVFERVLPRFARPLAGTLLHRARGLCRRACGAATTLVSVSDDYLRWGLDRAERQRTPLDAVFPHGYERPEFSAEQQSQAAAYWDDAGVADGPATRLCFFGSLGQSSALEPFLHAMRSLRETGRTDIELVVCGDGPKRDAYRRIAGECGSIRWADWIDQPKIVELMRRSHIGVAAYGADAPQSLPNKPIEYLAGGLAVLSTLGESELQSLLAEADCGETMAAPTAEAIARRFVAWADDPQRLAERRDNAARLFAERFEAATVYDAMADHLERVHAHYDQTAIPLGVAA